VKDKRKAKIPRCDSDSESDDESEESDVHVEEEFSYKDVSEDGDAGTRALASRPIQIFYVSGRAAETFAVRKGLTVVDLDCGNTGEEMASW
jgi:hypothetical protein